MCVDRDSRFQATPRKQGKGKDLGGTEPFPGFPAGLGQARRELEDFLLPMLSLTPDHLPLATRWLFGICPFLSLSAGSKYR